MQIRALTTTQTKLLPQGVPCSAIAVLVGNAILRAAPAEPDAAAIEHAMRIGCTVWGLLMAARHAKTAAADGDNMFTAADVLAGVVSSDTFTAPWHAEVELAGLHLRAGIDVPAGAREFLRATAAPASIVEFVSVDSLRAALDTAAARAATTGRSLAITVTYAGHTVVVVFVRDEYGTIVHAVDSLRGEWLRADEPATPDLLARVTADWCAPADTVDAAQFTANIFVRRAPRI